MDVYASTEGVFIATADCSTMNRYPGTGADLCNHYNLRGYPYLVYGNPDSVREYTGGRDYGSLLAFAEQYLGPVVPTPAPAPFPTPAPVPLPTPTPVPLPPTPTPAGHCPDDAQEIRQSDGVECLWQSVVGGFVMPTSAVEYCDYFSSGYLGYYWTTVDGDYSCVASARKTVSGDQTFCLWQDGQLGVSFPAGASADCSRLSQGSIGFVIPSVQQMQI